MSASRSPAILPADVLIEEERIPSYDPKRVLPVNPGDLLDVAKHERIITGHLKKNPSHEGFPFVRTMLDNFEVPGPDGPHLCLVYEPMREPLWLFQRRWGGKLPPALLKVT
jgi:hypothetical protein